MDNVTEKSIGPPLMRLHPDDDCLVAIRPLRSGETVLVEGTSVQVEADMPVGHKVASRFLGAGEPVRKCGAVIGRTTAKVEVGSLLHLHNLESNYLQAHLVGDADAGPARLAGEVSPVAASVQGTPTAVLAVADGAEARRRAHEANQTQAVPGFLGYLRSDGRKGIRNHLLVVYLVECAHHVAREIANGFGGPESSVEVVGFPGCYPNEYAQRILTALCTHPNVGGCLLVSLGCESFDRRALKDAVEATDRWVESLVIQHEGGTVSTVNSGRALVEAGLAQIATVGRVPMGVEELVIGTICGGSDSTSLLTANPAVGRAFDRLVAAGARCIFEETGELIGCEEHLRSRDLARARRRTG